MDFDDWEYLSDEDNGNVKGLISIDMDYFQKLMDPPKELEVDPIGVFSPPPEGDQETLHQFADMKLDLPNPQSELGRPQFGEREEGSECGDGGSKDKGVFGSSKEDQDQETLNEFADMKLDSPTPQIELGKPQFGEKEEGFGCGDDKGVFGACKEDKLEDKDEEELEDGKNGGGLNIWKVGMTGFGALCSFGFAFATICVIALGTRNRVRHRDQNLHFQMYTHDKRFKQVLNHAARLNGAISVVRGAPLSRAHISIGGYFEGL